MAESEIVERVSDAIRAINESKRVDEVICALHSLALLIFPIDSSLLAGTIGADYRDQILNAVSPSDFERDEWRRGFYGGAAFPTLARVLIYHVASSWLACFPTTARMLVYDSFFLGGLPVEVVQAVVPGMLPNASSSEDVDAKAVCANAERLLILFLLEKDGVLEMVRELGASPKSGESTNIVKTDNTVFISKLAQLVVSIPDKARLNAPAALSSQYPQNFCESLFFKKIVNQLFDGAEERAAEFFDRMEKLGGSTLDGTLLFVGESFARICRRGSTDIIIVEMIPRILDFVRSCLSAGTDHFNLDLISSKPSFVFWTRMIEAIKDPYAVERLAEYFLRQLAAANASDLEAYWILWILFHQTFKHQISVRSMFVDKFLLWKVFPVCCLRWILQFAILKCPPSGNGLARGENVRMLLERIQYVVPVGEASDLTAAVGLSLEKLSRDELEVTTDVMHAILQGVSCRLENPIVSIRRMASCVALVFSKVIDPENPLYLDDSFKGEPIDWDFGCSSKKELAPAVSQGIVRNRKKTLSKLVDPDEIVDPATLNIEKSSDIEDDDASEKLETTSESSLEPYDLSDDDVDLKKNFSQLVDIVGALRKPDDPDGVEKALYVVENLVRASPDELRHMSGELVRALLQVRCSDIAVEGEEDSAELKRQKALVALLATCPFESLDALNAQLYSPNLDVSQRILIIDVMIDAAQELADAKITKVKHQHRKLIETVSESQPWFLPNSEGPSGAGPWEEVSELGTLLNWSYCYERELPSKASQIKTGKSRRWSLQSTKTLEDQMNWSKNKFPVYAAAFMLPAMQGFDKKRHGVDLLGRDFIVLGKLIYMLGICMKCTSMHPEASALAPALLDMLRSREVSSHAEAYVRRSVAFAASCILIALHPSFVASALVEGNPEISAGFEWIRTWSVHAAESDTDNECSALAMTCLQLHAEMALQASRALETSENTFKMNAIAMPSSKRMIKVPTLHMGIKFEGHLTLSLNLHFRSRLFVLALRGKQHHVKGGYTRITPSKLLCLEKLRHRRALSPCLSSSFSTPQTSPAKER
ncbi:hypothetical protein Sjap_016376 [Stephania japonica]|uniref:Telomere length regulation protein conserved domain-containing protein n=1 Tax=Stephania japonica TaxID=461633 RepID=A0AAP0NTE9_9MAGN